MKQEPHYIIIGNGRVARHFSHYFCLLGCTFSAWSRQESIAKLYACLDKATHILLLISDNAIENFILNYLQNRTLTCIHFSGNLISDLAYGTHPLMSFVNNLYSLEQYTSIPFIVDHDAPAFELLFPHLPNKHWRLNKSLKAKYHALCVMSGNFGAMLWAKLFQSLEEDFNLPSTIAHPYLKQVTENIISNFKTAMTGPLVRNDTVTITENLSVLEKDPFKEIYMSFLSCYQAQKKEEVV